MTASLLTQGTPSPSGQVPADAKPVGEQTQPTQTPTPQSGETKPSDPKPAEAPKPAEPPKPVVPEKYEFKTPKGIPEGHELDGKVISEFSVVAKELGLSQENAQKVIDRVMPSIHQRQVEQTAEIHKQWVDSVKTDKELGGEKLDANLAIAKRGAKAYGTPELQKLLDGPLGSNPEVIRFLYRVGKTVSEDGFVAGSKPTQAADPNDPSEQARKMYPKSQ